MPLYISVNREGENLHTGDEHCSICGLVVLCTSSLSTCTSSSGEALSILV